MLASTLSSLGLLAMVLVPGVLPWPTKKHNPSKGGLRWSWRPSHRNVTIESPHMTPPPQFQPPPPPPPPLPVQPHRPWSRPGHKNVTITCGQPGNECGKKEHAPTSPSCPAPKENCKHYKSKRPQCHEHESDSHDDDDDDDSDDDSDDESHDWHHESGEEDHHESWNEDYHKRRDGMVRVMV